jgi:hypothetical protein
VHWAPHLDAHAPQQRGVLGADVVPGPVVEPALVRGVHVRLPQQVQHRVVAAPS